RIAFDLLVGERTEAVVRVHDGTEVLEARAAERGIVREQEVSAPVALACNGAVGLGVDGEEQAALASGLRQAADYDEDVAVRVRVHRAGAQRVPGEPDGIEVGPVVVAGRASRAGLRGRGDVTEKLLHAFDGRGTRRARVESRAPVAASRGLPALASR